MRNFLYFADYSCRAYLRKPFKNISLTLFLAIIVFIFSGLEFTEKAYFHEAERELFYQPDLIIQRVVAGRQMPISGRYIRWISNIPGVSDAYGRIWGYYFDTYTGVNFTVVGDKGDLVDNWNLIVKNFSGGLGEDEALVGEGVLKVRHLKVGDYLNLYNWKGEPVTLKIKGSFVSDVSLWTYDLIVVKESTARKLFGMKKGEFWDIAVWIPNELEVANIGEKIIARIPGTRLIAKKQLRRTFAAAFGFRGGVLMLFASFALLAFIIVTYEKASGLSREEQYEIAVLKAVGWLTKDVIWIKMFENLLISLTGYIIGIVASYYHVFVFGSPLFKRLLAGWSVIYPPHPLPAHLDLGKVLGFMFFTVVPFIVASIIPVWRSAIIDPEEIFRGG